MIALISWQCTKVYDAVHQETVILHAAENCLFCRSDLRIATYLILVAPEGRKVYRNVDPTYSKAPEGRQVETADVTPFNIRSLGAVSIIGEASLKS